MTTAIMNEFDSKSKKAISYLRDELSKIRAGRANPSLLDSIQVEAYGVKTPLNQVASISVPEARLLQIQPWDTGLLKEIERAILKSELGITPSSDGKVIRLPFPPLTQDRRKDLVKQAAALAEQTKITVRAARRDAIDAIKKMEKAGELREDESKSKQEDVQKRVDTEIENIEKIVKEKEAELMEI